MTTKLFKDLARPLVNNDKNPTRIEDEFIESYMEYLTILHEIWIKQPDSVKNPKCVNALFIPRVRGIELIFDEKYLEDYNRVIIDRRNSIRKSFPNITGEVEFNGYDEDNFTDDTSKIYIQVIVNSYFSDFVVPWSVGYSPQYLHVVMSSTIGVRLQKCAERIVNIVDRKLVEQLTLDNEFEKKSLNDKEKLDEILEKHYNIRDVDNRNHIIRYLRMGAQLSEIMRDLNL